MPVEVGGRRGAVRDDSGRITRTTRTHVGREVDTGDAAHDVDAMVVLGAIAFAFGALILRRRGVYFSLLTLALTAMIYSVAFRWTAVTGGPLTITICPFPLSLSTM